MQATCKGSWLLKMAAVSLSTCTSKLHESCPGCLQTAARAHPEGFRVANFGSQRWELLAEVCHAEALEALHLLLQSQIHGCAAHGINGSLCMLSKMQLSIAQHKVAPCRG